MAVGVPRERIVQCNREENFWQAGPTGPCGPCSELYFDRGVEFGKADDLPGGENERFLEYWNLVFMQFNQDPVGTLTPLPAQNIDTGLGLNRMAAILQDKPSVFETDQFWPLIELGQELSGRRYGETFEVDRALRILADHSRGMSFLIADGVVPSNEDRGYVLRRIMRRPSCRGGGSGSSRASCRSFAAGVRELMGAAYPELSEQADTIDMWLAREEEAFGQTLEQGTRILEEHIARAKEAGAEGIGAGRGLPAPRHLRLPVRPHARARGRAGAGRRRAGLRGPDGGPAHAGARERRPRRARRGPRARQRVRRRRRLRHDLHGLRDGRADDGGRRRRAGRGVSR